MQRRFSPNSAIIERVVTRDFRRVHLVEGIQTVRVIVVSDRDRMYIQTPRHRLYPDKFRLLGSDRKTTVRDALLYVRAHHSFGGRVLVNCVVVEGERVKSNAPRTAFRKRVRCFSCFGPEQLTNHHIIPRSRGGQEDTRNIAVLCQPCHTGLEYKLELMERIPSPPLTYVDFVAVLVTFTLAQRHRNDST
ncbi:MAG: HNH endonuclease [Candidatus Micrarchaeota archaeon]|nr:HNH endonuclease [Candidatus Micrarchaeota archaeon]